MYKTFLIGILFLFIFSCQNNTAKQTYTAQQIDSLKQAFTIHKQQIEREFQTADWSPLTEADKANFKGLNYYPYHVSWRFQGPVVRYEKIDSITIRGSKEGDLRPALKYGYFEFEKDEQKYQLQIIKILPGKPGRKAHLFLGFWDETSGRETYGGGRYIDIAENPQNFYTVDFNFAYNPYCAYSSRYSCAVPPFENRLKLAVYAGEKIFKEHH